MSKLEKNLIVGVVGQAKYSRVKYEDIEIGDKTKGIDEKYKILEEYLYSLPIFKIVRAYSNSDNLNNKVILFAKKEDKEDKYYVKFQIDELEELEELEDGENFIFEKDYLKINIKYILEKIFNIRGDGCKILNTDDYIKMEYHNFYNSFIKELSNIGDEDEKYNLIFDVSTGVTNIIEMFNLIISPLENIKGHKIKQIYYGFRDLQFSNDPLHINEFFEYNKAIQENKKIEHLKRFKNNYTLDKEFKDNINNEEDKDLKKYLSLIEKFYESLHIASFYDIENSLNEIKSNKGLLGVNKDSIINTILEDIHENLLELLDDKSLSLDKLQDDLIKKEYYQLLITVLEGKFRKDIVANCLLKNKEDIDKITGKDLYDYSQFLLTGRSSVSTAQRACDLIDDNKYTHYECSDIFGSNSLLKDKWKLFKDYRNSINHGLRSIENNDDIKEEVKSITDSVIELIKKL